MFFSQRFCVSLLTASIITYALFYIIGWLVQGKTYDAINSSPVTINFLPLNYDVNQFHDRTRLSPPELPKLRSLPTLASFEMNEPQADLAKLVNFDSYQILDIRTGLLGFATQIFSPLSRVEPIYPAFASSRGIEGWVKISFTLNQRGQVVSPEVLESNPAGIFDHSALNAVAQWRYPTALAQYGNERFNVLIKFQLQQ